VGPVVAGLLYDAGDALPYFAAAGLTALSFALALAVEERRDGSAPVLSGAGATPAP